MTHRYISLESASSASQSSSSSESKEKKKTVGVRTDVTFEITSAESNDTQTVDDKEISKDGKEDKNADDNVIFFKGKPDRGSKPATKNPNDNELWSVKPLEYPNNPSKDDRNPIDNSWNQVPQYAIWTTERYNHRNRHDQPVYHHRGQSNF